MLTGVHAKINRDNVLKSNNKCLGGVWERKHGLAEVLGF